MPFTATQASPRPQFKLHRRLTLLVVLLAIGTTLAVAVGAYTHERRVLIDNTVERLDAVASVQQARLNAHLSASLQMLSLISSRTQMRLSLEEYHRSGAITERATVERILTDARDATTEILAIHVTDVDGMISASTTPAMRGKSITDWGLAARPPDGPVIGPVTNASDERLVQLLAAPLLLDGTEIGTVVLESSTAPLVALVTDYTGLGSTGETQLAGLAADGNPVFIAPLRFDPEATMRPLPEGVMKNAMAGIENMELIGTDYRGVPVYAVTRFVEIANWGVVVKIDAAEAMQPVADLARTALVTIFAAGLLAAILGWFGARSISRPIRNLTETALSISAGDRHLRASEGRSDEFGTLAVAFNDMTDKLTTLTHSLEVRGEELRRHAAELGRSSERLSALVESKDRLIASVSHELRTPLTAVVGYVELLREPQSTLDPQERAEVTELIAQQSQDLTDLIQDLLVAAVSEDHPISLDLSTIDLADLTARVVAGFAAAHPGEVDVPIDGAATAVGDAIRVRQVVRNLVSNTLRYGGDQRRIEIEEGPEFAIVRVVDNGPGPEPGGEEHIFDAYVSGHRVPGLTGSVGLGLTVSRRLADLMGGSVSYRRQDGESIFEFCLPLSVPKPVKSAG